MKGSRRGKENKEKGLPTPNPYVDGGNSVKTKVYNTKEDKKKGGRKRKKKKKREKKSKRLKKYNSKKEEFITLSSSTRACPRILFVSVRV